MRRDLTKSNKANRMLSTRRPSFFTPWFEDFLEPTGWFDDLRRDLAPLYDENQFLTPAIDIDETDKEYIVSADLPGVKKEDISVECSGNQLTISAERKSDSNEGRRSGRRERYYGSYQRSFTLPVGSDTEKVDATYEGGVLSVRIPKGEESHPHRIEIKDNKSSSQEQVKVQGSQNSQSNSKQGRSDKSSAV